MTPRDIARRRLVQQRIAGAKFKTPNDVVASLGAVQAQNFLGALWGIGLRMADATEPQVEQAIADRTIVRTWPMRGTLHFVAAPDVHWMLELLTPRVIAGAKGRMRQFGIDDAAISRSRELLVGALQGGKKLSRTGIYKMLDSAGVSTSGQRGLHILWRLAHDGLLCLGPRIGKQQTFVLLDEWVPRGKRLRREAALSELALRYFVGHGPATLQDFAWWSGLTISDARVGLEAVSTQLSNHMADGKAYWTSPKIPESRGASEGYLLPPFDEFLVGYADRTAALDPSNKVEPPAPSMVLGPAVVVDGRLKGAWTRTGTKNKVSVAVAPFSPLRDAELRALSVPAQKYGRFLGVPSELKI
ncbi:MAG: winged helix DNA-binding domain-containing protein [Thaumarchaeota archaeon]|nr:winged helix DNA-binding domain-containing protein [Nitrososphaerota archaeon]